ncbi:hypothetical protein SUGI_0080910 [Cryptomeria japonica]|nr:hypothetical protein SUGI_0080910 [Cryptomeria japonica]
MWREGERKKEIERPAVWFGILWSHGSTTLENLWRWLGIGCGAGLSGAHVAVRNCRLPGAKKAQALRRENE